MDEQRVAEAFVELADTLVDESSTRAAVAEVTAD
jgi:hypothetical protein